MVVDYITQRTPEEKAAPELLAACKAAESELDGDPHRRDLQAALRAAIAKAEGK